MKLVSPSARESTAWINAVSFVKYVPKVGFVIPPRSVEPRWFLDSWGENLDIGWVMLDDARPPIPIHLKAGRLQYEPETALLKTVFHELAHAHQVLSRPRILEEETKDWIEQDAERFAWRALEAWEAHEAEWQRLLVLGADRWLATQKERNR